MSVKKASSSLVSRSRVGFTPTGGGAAVTISNVIVTDSSWNNLDDTAVGTSSSYIKIIGSGFTVNPSVYVGTTQVSSGSITFVSSIELRVVLPSLSLGTQNLFVFNTDYSGAIWSAGLVVSGFPDYTQTTYTSATALSVSVQLLATGDAPLTYALQGGSSLPAGTSLSSSGLITGTTTDGTYQFTVIVSDAQNQSFQQQLTLTIASADQYFNITPLAINGDVNTFVSDGSTNNFPVTIIGDTKPFSFSPYNTNWSNYFDGTGDYLNVASNSAFTLGSSGDFTVECWCYLTATPNNYTPLITTWTDANNAFTNRWAINIYGSKLSWFNDAGGIGIADSSNIGLNQWIHVAAVRSGSTITLYKNGVSLGTQTTSQAYTTQSGVTIGFVNNGGYITGWISNARVVKGTAVYTSAFTPSTTPLTAITNTSLLTCQSNRFIDNSTNTFTITRNGDTKVSAFGPFTETDTTTGSGYFDGTGDYLTIPYNSAWDFGTGNFTIETWLYPTTSGTARVIASSFINNGNDGWSWELTTGNLLTFYAESAFVVTSSLAISSNKWTHIAVSRSGSTLKLFVDGVESGTATYSTSIAGFSGLLAISATSTGVAPFVGYQSNFRLVKGTAVYTSAFTPPTAPLTAVTNTSLLTLQTRQPVNNHTFIDVSGNNNLITRTGNASQGSFSPFSPAGWSAYFDGTGDYLSLSARSFAGDFTLEAWIYPLRFADSGGSSILFCSTSPNNQVALSASGVTTYYNGSTSTSSATGRIVLNTWQHYAISRSGATTRIFVNGVLVASNLSDSGTRTFTFIGQFPDGNNYYFQGYMSNVRWATTTRYTAAFTPPSSILSSDANTSLLTCQSNRFIDNSTNNFTITQNADVKIVNFSPFAPTAAYSTITHGGSAYFDGSDYVVVGQGFNTSLGTNNWTVEGWFYPTGTSTSQRLFWHYGNTIDIISIYFNASTGVITGQCRATNLADTTLTGTATRAKPGQWTHVALVRESTTSVKLYVNGVLDATGTIGATASFNETTVATVRYGASSNPDANYFTGYLSDWRFVKGRAVYTAAFTPPSSLPLTADAVHQLEFNNAAIVDVSSRNNMECVGDAKIVTSTRKYGTGSMSFDGTGDVILCINTAEPLGFGTGDFTIECWAYLTNYSSEKPILYKFVAWASNVDFAFRVDGSTGLVRFLAGDSTPINITSNSAIPLNQWVHLAVTRSSGVTRIFVNGVVQTSTHTGSVSIPNESKTLFIGGDAASPSVSWNGYIDDLRFTTGYARYTANFTPPTITFLAQ